MIKLFIILIDSCSVSFFLICITYFLALFLLTVGTGSGSLSHALTRTVRPHGHLYTFDFHEQRVNVAHAEFHRHGLSEFVTVKHKDVCKEGFGEELKNKVDAIFLDLPHPWLAIDHVLYAFKKSGIKEFHLFS